VRRPTNPDALRAGRRRTARAPVSQIAVRQSSKTQPRPPPASTAGAVAGRRLSDRKRVLGLVAALATILGILSSSTALFDWFGSKVNPVIPPPAHIDARLTSTVLRGRESLGDYLRETNQSTTGLSNFELAEQGFVFLIGIHPQGDLGRTVLLRWSIIDNATGTALPDPIYNQPASKFRPRGPDKARQWPIWVPSPPTRGRFKLRATLLDEKHLPLDEADSKPFTLTKAPNP
jgi:hypothetical protein